MRTDIERSGWPGRTGMGRRAFVVGAAAAVAAAACGGDGPGRDDRDDRGAREASSTTEAAGRRGLRWKGVNYDTDRELWRSAYVRREIEAIRRDLHANSVFLLGSDLDRLTEAAAAAADAAEQVDGAFVYDFIEPGNPHRPDPRHDLDMAGFGIVTCFPPDHDRAHARTGHFEPKEAFATIARHFG